MENADTATTPVAEQVEESTSSSSVAAAQPEDDEIPSHTEKWTDAERELYSHVERERCDTVAAKDHVILDVGDGDRMFVDVRPGRTVKIGKQKCSLDALIGAKFGTVFEADRGESGSVACSWRSS